MNDNDDDSGQNMIVLFCDKLSVFSLQDWMGEGWHQAKIFFSILWMTHFLEGVPSEFSWKSYVVNSNGRWSVHVNEKSFGAPVTWAQIDS